MASFQAILEDAFVSIPKVHKLEILVSKIDLEIKSDPIILANAKEFYDEAENIFKQVCNVFKINIEELKNNP